MAVARLHRLLALLFVWLGGVALILFLLDAALQVAGGLILVFVHAGLPGNEKPVSARRGRHTVRLLTEWHNLA